MTNQEILEELCKAKDNGEAVNAHLDEWDTKEPFPIQDVNRYIKLNEWTKDNFNVHMELTILKLMPEWFCKIFLCMKEFIYTPYPSLNSSEETFAKLMGYPTETTREKAFCVYNYAMHYYIENEGEQLHAK